MIIRWGLALLTLCSLSVCPARAGREDDYLMRVSWVKTMKTLLLEIEQKNPDLLVEREKSFLQNFTLINEAWADSRYNCFFGGWPSVLVSSGKKKYCTNPMRGNSSYNKGACSSGELQCQPLLFGKDLCVSFKTQKDRNSSFASCEKKFLDTHQGSYEFLKSPSRKEVEDLRELSIVAGEICKDNSGSICRNIMHKLPMGLKALESAHQEAVSELPTPTRETSTPTLIAKPHAEDCNGPSHTHETLAQVVEEVAATSESDLYEKMKKDFEASPFCEPTKIINDPVKKPSAVVMAKLYQDLRGFDSLGNSSGESLIERMIQKYHLSSDVKAQLFPFTNEISKTSNLNERRTLVAKVKGLLIQNYLKNYRPDNSFDDEIKNELVKQHIFTKNSEGEISCPFISKDAFLKAISGREKVINKYGSSISKKNQITIVDYTRPSNERRMFVLDLKSGKVLHNTWVAHGGGGGNADGVDGLGSSPEVSNISGSNKSSDGFIIASSASSGKLFGPNVLLKGVDSGNTNIASRAIVLHGWGSPMGSYNSGLQDYHYDTDSFGPNYDVIENIKKMDYKNASLKEMERSLWNIPTATASAKYLGATEGCLGVPVINVKHLDSKGRDKTQLEMLREDLPGSVIFNYSGPQMNSKYL